jgi:hypothetical protein
VSLNHGVADFSLQSIGFTMGLVMISSNIGSYSKRVVVSSCVFIAYCAGNAGMSLSQDVDCADRPVGPLTALESEAPVYRTAAICMMAGYLLKTICHCLLWFYVSVPLLFFGDADIVDVARQQGS